MSKDKPNDGGNAMDSNKAVEAIHRAICEDSLKECLEWDGRCVTAVQAIEQHVIWIGAAK